MNSPRHFWKWRCQLDLYSLAIWKGPSVGAIKVLVLLKYYAFCWKPEILIEIKPRNEILFLFSCYNGLLSTYYSNPCGPVSAFCRVGSRISLNLFTTNVTFKNSDIYSSIFYVIQVTFLNLLAVIDVYNPEKCLELAES